MFTWPIIKSSAVFGSIILVAAGTGVTVGSESQITIKDAYAVGAVVFACAIWVVVSFYKLKLLILEKSSETTNAVNASAASAATAAGHATVSATHATTAAIHAETAAKESELAFAGLRGDLEKIKDQLDELPCSRPKSKIACRTLEV